MKLTDTEFMSLLSSAWIEVVQWWNSDSNLPYYLWMAAGVALVWGCLWVSYSSYHLAKGDYRINGVWITYEHLQELLDVLQRKEHDGALLDAKDINLLNRFRPDRLVHLKKLGDKDYVAW